MTPPHDRRTVRRCHSCGSRLPDGERRCAVCGAAVPWYLTPRGVLLESVVAILAVVLAIGALMWLRDRDVPVADGPRGNVYQAVTALPTAPPTFTVAPSATAPVSATAVLPPDAEPLLVATAPAAGAASLAGAAAITYTVRSGDNLWAIAQELEVPLETIRTANPGSDQRLDVGQILTIPVTPEPGAVAAAQPAESMAVAAAPAPTAPPPVPELYAIRGDDTLASIAAEHGLTVADLRAMNYADLPLPGGELVPGHVLRVRFPSGHRDGRLPNPATPLPFPSPLLLAPGDGVTVDDDAPLLRWVSAGLLPEDVYYVVSLRDAAAEGGVKEELVWVLGDANTLTMPARFRPAMGASRTIVWQVTVRRSNGGGAGVVLSAAPESRTIIWAP